MAARPLSFWQQLTIWWRVFTDKRTPTWLKVIVVLSLLYGISPLDLIADVVPFIGLLDDLFIIGVVLYTFYQKMKSLFTQFRHSAGREVIDVEVVKTNTEE